MYQTWYRYLNRGVRACIDLMVPPMCAFCKKFLSSRVVLCARCELTIHPIASAIISITPSHGMTVFAISAYQDPIKRLIVAKSNGNIVASSQLGQLIWDYTHIRNVPFDCIVPIPLHWRRFAKRGYNQAEEIAGVLAEKSGKPMASLLHRTRWTPFQSQVRPDERLSNVAHVFELDTKKKADAYKNKHLLLVDDVSTTGATLQSAAKVLWQLKPASITAVVAARVV